MTAAVGPDLVCSDAVTWVHADRGELIFTNAKCWTHVVAVFTLPRSAVSIEVVDK